MILIEAFVLFLLIMIFAWFWLVEPRLGRYIPEDWSVEEE